MRYSKRYRKTLTKADWIILRMTRLAARNTTRLRLTREPDYTLTMNYLIDKYGRCTLLAAIEALRAEFMQK